MASLTIRKFDEKLKKRLRMRAARHGRSMEEEARQILADGRARKRVAAPNLADAIASLVDPIGGIELRLSGLHYVVMLRESGASSIRRNLGEIDRVW